MTTLNPSAREFVPNFVLPSAFLAVPLPPPHATLESVTQLTTSQDVRNLSSSRKHNKIKVRVDAGEIEEQTRTSTANRRKQQQRRNIDNISETRKALEPEPTKQVKHSDPLVQDKSKKSGRQKSANKPQFDDNNNRPSSGSNKQKPRSKKNNNNEGRKQEKAKIKLDNDTSQDDNINHVEEVEIAPSPYLLALKKAASIPVQQPLIVSNEGTDVADTAHIQDNEGKKAQFTNKVVKVVSQRVVEALKPTWIQISLDLAKREKERDEQAAQLLLQNKQGQRTSSGKDSQPHIWNSILRPITEPVRNEEYFRADVEQQSMKKQPSTFGCATSELHLHHVADDDVPFISKSQWWTAVFTAQVDVVMQYLEAGCCSWEDRYEGDVVDWGDCSFRFDSLETTGMTTLHIFAKYSHYELCFHHLLTLSSVQRSIDMKDRALKRTVLHYASEQGSLTIVQSLLKLGVEVNVRDKHGDTPLHLASLHQHISIVQLLLDKCSRSDELKVNIRNKKGQHALLLSKSRNMTVLLLEYGADPTVQDSEGNTAVSLAAQHGEYGILKTLLSCNAFKSLDTRSKYDVLDLGFLPLSTPSTHPSKVPLKETSPLHQAVLSKHASCLRLLLEYPYYDINGFDKPQMCTPLMYACMLGSVNAVLLLLQRGAVSGCYTTTTLSVALLPEASSGGLNEVALAAINKHDVLLRQVSNFLRTTSSKSKLFTALNDKGHYALTEVANQVFIHHKQQYLEGNTLLTTEAKDDLKQAILQQYNSVFATLIACGTPLSKRFYDLYASEDCKTWLKSHHLFVDWMPSRVQDNLDKEDDVHDSVPKSFADYFPQAYYDSLPMQIAVTSSHMFDVIFRVRDHQLLVSQVFIWKLHSPAMQAMFASPLCKRITFEEACCRYSSIHREQFALMHAAQDIFDVDFSHASLDIMQVMEAYLHTADPDVITTLQEAQQLIDLLYLCNELLLPRLQVLVEMRIFALQVYFSKDELQQLVSMLSPTALSKLVNRDTHYCEYVAMPSMKTTAMQKSPKQCRVEGTDRKALFEILHTLQIWHQQDIYIGSKNALSSLENIDLRIQVKTESNGSFSTARFDVEQHHYSVLCEHCTHYLQLGYRTQQALMPNGTYVHSDLQAKRLEVMQLFNPSNSDANMILRFNMPCQVNVESLETMQQVCDDMGKWMKLLYHVRIPLLQSKETANLILSCNSRGLATRSMPISVLDNLDNLLGSSLFFVHKEIIYASGDKFEAMLKFQYQTQQQQGGIKSSNAEEEIIDVLPLESLSATALYFLVQFLYMGIVPIRTFREHPSLSSHMILLELALFGSEYLLPSLYAQCSKLMLMFLHVDNASEVYEFAFRHQLHDIERLAALFLMKLMNTSTMPLSAILNVDQMHEDMEVATGDEKSTKEDVEVGFSTQKLILHQETDCYIRDFLTGLLTSIIS